MGHPRRAGEVRSARQERREATLLSNDTLAGLYGLPVNAMSLVLDPEGKLNE